MEFKFIPHIIDADLPGKHFAQTALADLDNDGRPEYIVGEMKGNIYWYKFHTPEKWSRHLLGQQSPSDVGGCVLDVDGDGWLDFVAGGAWYRNSRNPDKPFERIVFDPDLAAVHDIVAADIDGDGRKEIITMSDQNNLRWYKIPSNPTARWERVDVGPSVHAGVSVGDLNHDGHLDIVRTDVWFENTSGNGTTWVQHPIGPNTPPPADFCPPFAYNATKSLVCDMNKDGKNDVVFTDAEIPGGKIWWMENLGNGLGWKRHEIPNADPIRRGAYHTLQLVDFDADGDHDLLTCEMEIVRGDRSPRWYIWENLDGQGGAWKEHVILDMNLGGHEAVVDDVTGNGLPDIISKPWIPYPQNALGGKGYVVFLENVSKR